MKIELKNLKHAAFASEETHCFRATVYIDGKKEGETSNDGHGGPNAYSPNSLYLKLEAYAKTLPEVEVEPDCTIQPDADCVIGDLVNLELAKKDLRKMLKGKIVFVRGADIFTVKVKADNPADLAIRMQKALQDPEGFCKKFSADHILNLLPEDEAAVALLNMKQFLSEQSAKSEPASAPKG